MEFIVLLIQLQKIIKDEYSLEFNSNEMELNYLKNNKKVYKKTYNFEEIINTIKCNLVEILLENI